MSIYTTWTLGQPDPENVVCGCCAEEYDAANPGIDLEWTTPALVIDSECKVCGYLAFWDWANDTEEGRLWQRSTAPA